MAELSTLTGDFLKSAFREGNKATRFAFWAAVAPHIVGVIVCFAYWFTRDEIWPVVAAYTGLTCLFLLFVGLTCVAGDSYIHRGWSKLGWLAFVIHL